jgi:fumarate reductase subunit C
MTPHSSTKIKRHPPYRRPMTGWWKRDPFFMRYMLRETTAFAVAAYAIVLCVGVVRLAQGEAAWNGWLQALRSPLSLLLHLVLLVAFAIHAYSWFQIMPKTLPMIKMGGEQVSAGAIQRTGWTAAALATVVVLLLAAWWQS